MDETMVSLDRAAELSDAERAALRALTLAVYPPEQWADWPGYQMEWAPAEWCVRLVDADGRVLCHVGMVVRAANHDRRAVRIGGIGGVKTHPAARGRGHARRAIQHALEFFRAQTDVAFALLVCETHLMDYYAGLGWRPFAGRLLVTQHGVPGAFTFLRVMVYGIQSEAPASGTIDLCGPPW